MEASECLHFLECDAQMVVWTVIDEGLLWCLAVAKALQDLDLRAGF